MEKSTVIIITLIVYKLVLVGIGYFTQRLTHNEKDFFLAGGSLGPWVAALSASASSSSAWTLLGVSGAAYRWGFAAIWLFPAVMLGFLFNWYYVAPRLYKKSRTDSAITLTEVLAKDTNQSIQKALTVLCSVIILVCFVFYIASQFDAAGSTFMTTFGMDREVSIILGAGIILFYTLMGGFWAVSITDSLQGLMMVLAAIILPVTALFEVYQVTGFDGLLMMSSNDGLYEITPGFSGAMAFAFVVGTLGIGLGYPGQPHVVNRFMALKDERAIVVAKRIAIGWALLIYSGMILLGWAARLLVDTKTAGTEQVLMILANELLHPVISGVLIASILSAIMSTADSQLLTAGASVSHDLRGLKQSTSNNSLFYTRTTIAGLCVLSVLMTLYVEQSIYSRVLFAWSAVGAAFGPLLLFRINDIKVKSGAALLAVATGFCLTLIFYYQENTAGDYLERLVPFILSFLILFFSREKNA